MDTNLNPILQNILKQRGVDGEKLEEFLSPKPALTYDPFLLTDMRAGVDLLLSEIDAGKRIVIYGDYDADGVTSTAVLMKALRTLTDNVTYYIPSRIDEGYGLNMDAIDRIKADGGEVIVTVDCGAVSRAETEYAHSLGLTTIVTDHHNVGEAVAEGIVIDPRRPDDAYPFKGLAGVGVAYKLVQAMDRERGFSRALMTELIELVTVGTIADVMPLVDENRTIAKYGLRLMRAGCANRGLRRLIELSGLKTETLRASNISFGIAPRINSAGRIGDASLGVRLLLSENSEEIEACCTKLIELNSRRKAFQDTAYEQCAVKAEEELAKGNDFLLLKCEDGHEGVLGIVAGKVKEDKQRPVIIYAENGDFYKGTGRSIPQVDLFNMLDRYRDEFERFGGHSAACGFLIKKDRIGALREGLNEDLRRLSAGDESFFDERLSIDADVEPCDITVGLADEFELLEPCGQGNEQPQLALRNVTIDDWRYLKGGTKYAKLNIGELSCLLFHNAENYHELYEAAEPVDVIGSIEINEWNGMRSVQMIVNKIKKV